MSERAAYSRVYWSIVDDPKFETIYDTDAHLAAWLRLLLVADQAHPTSAYLPSNVRKSSVTALSEVGLVDLLPRNRFRIHGLDAERERRRAWATSRGEPKPVQVPDDDRTGTERSPSGSSTYDLSLDKPSTSTRQAEDVARADDDKDPADIYWQLVGRYPTQKTLGWIDDLAAKFGGTAVVRALVTAHIEDKSTATLMGRAQDRLRAEARELDRKERAAEQSRLQEKRAKPPAMDQWREEYRRHLEQEYGDAA